MEHSSHEIQSVLFDKKKFDQTKAVAFLKSHHLKPIKAVHITKNKLRYRINPPSMFKRFRIKHITDGVEFVLGF